MVSENRKKWYAANSERLKRKAKEYRLKNIDEYKSRDRATQKRFKNEVIAYYSNNLNKCEHCSENRLATLTIDHKEGGGRAHRTKLKLPAGWVFYRWLVANGFPDGYRVLCSNCNWRHYLNKNNDKLSASAAAQRNRQRRLKHKRLVMSRLGDKCGNCANDDINILTIHHSEDNGAIHRRQVKVTGRDFYHELLMTGDFSGLECLCFSCNDALEWESM